MGLKSFFKAQKAYKAHADGDAKTAMRLYEEAMADGMDQPRYLLSYSVLLIRDGQYEKARKILVDMQRHPSLTPDQKTELFVDYAACAFRMGELDKAVNLLTRQHQHAPSGLLYQTLGYLLVEKFSPEHTPVFDALEAAAAAEELPPEEPSANEENGQAEDAEAAAVPEAPAVPSPREKWQQGLAEAEAFLAEAVDYDDEDAICLDNMGQFLYRVKGDREGARAWFDRAIGLKPNQIDTLWFLSRYDLESGNKAAALEKLHRAAEGRFSPLNYVSKAAIEAEIASLEG